MIEVDGLVKRYGSITAVDQVSFRAEPGGVFGLLGPNGAGKSTTLGCLCGFVAPDEGRVTLLEHDLALQPTRARERLGVVPQELALYKDLSARANLRFWGGAYGLRGAALEGRADTVLEQVGLSDRADDPVRTFSGGMQRRLNVACGLVHEPRILLLDEPTAGVDPQSRARLLDLVRELAGEGLTVLYTTHYMDEAEELCDQLAILDHGRLVANGSLEELRTLIGERDMLRLSGRFPPDPVSRRLGDLPDLEVVAVTEEGVTLAVEDAGRRLAEVLDAVGAEGGEVRETTVTRPSLESLFLKLTGRELRE